MQYALIAYNPKREPTRRCIVHRGFETAEKAFLAAWHGANVHASAWSTLIEGEAFRAEFDGRFYLVIAYNPMDKGTHRRLDEIAAKLKLHHERKATLSPEEYINLGAQLAALSLGRVSHEFDDINKAREFMEANGLKINGTKGWMAPGLIGIIDFHQDKWHAVFWASELAEVA